MKTLVFICSGNMFRSQLAESIFNSNPIVGWRALSYGTDVTAERLEGIELGSYGKGVHFAIEEMKKMGMDISQKICKQLIPEYLDKADKVIVMSEPKYTPKWLSDLNLERWEVKNPDYITPKIAKETTALLADKIDKLKTSLI